MSAMPTAIRMLGTAVLMAVCTSPPQPANPKAASTAPNTATKGSSTPAASAAAGQEQGGDPQRHRHQALDVGSGDLLEGVGHGRPARHVDDVVAALALGGDLAERPG